MKKVFITRRIPEVAINILRQSCSVYVNNKDRQLTKKEIIAGVKDMDAILSLLTDRIDREVMDASKNLKIIANYAVGYDNIDIEEATERGIVVTNTPGVLTETTADLAWALLFAIARRITEGDRFMREGRFKGWAPTLLLGYDIYGKTLGVIGTGRIGTAFALRSKGFGMKVLYYNRSRNLPLEKILGAKKVTLKRLLSESDFISLHIPLTQETYHLIGRSEFALMKKTAIIVNTSRGPVIDEKILTEALLKGKIAGAALDVYENEPFVTKKLLRLNNVVLTPHIGSASYETREKMARMAAESIIDIFQGNIPENIVNREALET